MGFYSGNSGKIQFAKQPAGNADPSWKDDLPIRITQWTMNSSVQLLDTTTLGDWDKTSEYGLRTHAGTLKMFYYSDENQSSPINSAASWFIGALTMAATQGGRGDQGLTAFPDSGDYLQSKSAIPLRLKLYLRSAGSSSQDFVSFNARLTSVGYASTVNEVTSVDVQFEATGQILVGNQ